MTGGQQPVFGPSRFAWADLDRDSARSLWTDLTTWVDWFRERYQPGSKITPCWYRHGAVVEELTALMAAHKAVYVVDRGVPEPWTENLTAWHTQWMRSAVDAVARLLADCTDQHCAHRPHPPKIATDLGGFIRDDIARRPAPNRGSTP
ncbi:hypothetical protein [Nocardia sp. alder85J]|uniref:hypothetical protein n=1 Tax=Nocardia sp. alder85J TaxID=2862949 RepID=UPI001CD37AC7|nr:hypothetical protein [Nocardia sp. alder85J]MCX4097704.1 hypothetical protein [Nocardia sp. alder85J]